MESARNIIPIKQPQEIILFDLSESVFSEIKTYESLEITDSKTETDVRQARAAVRDVRYKIQRRHKELNADLNQQKKEYKDMAESLIERLTPTETNLDEKIKAVEAVKEVEKAERMAKEQARLDVIRGKLANIDTITNAGMDATLSSNQIDEFLKQLHEISITDEDFQEFREQADINLARNIEALNAAFERALFYEESAKIQAESEAKNKAEAERLAKIAEDQEIIAAAIKADQEEQSRLAQVERDKADAHAKAERDAENARIVADRAELEKARAEIQAEKDRMAQVAEAEKFKERVAWCERIGTEWFEADWNEAHHLNIEFNLAIEKAAAIEAARKEELKPDTEKLLMFADYIGEIKLPDLKTDAANEIGMMIDARLRELVSKIMAEVESL